MFFVTSFRDWDDEIVFTFFKENYLVVLVEFHEAWNHFCKFDDLFDQVC